MEKVVENVSLVNKNIAGTPTATPVTPLRAEAKIVREHRTMM